MKDNIAIIGPGTVGKAWGKVLEDFGYTVYYFDKDDDLDIISDLDIELIFICTPETVVEEVVNSLAKYTIMPIVCRSTCLPGTANRISKNLINKYYVMPEFLKERNAYETAKNPDRIVIGTKNGNEYGTKNMPVILNDILFQFSCPVYETNYKEAESIKLIANNLLSLLISFWNEMYMAGLATQKVAKIVCEDKTLSSCYRIFGRAYGGSCFPKDVMQMLKYLQDNEKAFLNITAANKYINDIMIYKYGANKSSLEELMEEDKTEV